MKRVLLLALLLALAASAGHFARGGPIAEASGTTPTERATRFEYPGADFVTVVSQECLPGNRVRIFVNWNPYNFGPQWIDLSLFNNDFIFGTFIGLGPMPPNQNNFMWDGLLPGLRHYLRINTLTAFGWFPSATITFVTRNDCGFALIDSDGDGIADVSDACPTLPGPAVNNGCPFNQGATNCDPVTGWCPGQPPPPSRCPVQPQILIFPPPAAGCVWPTKGNGATYVNGEPIRICYWVNQAMNVLVQSQRPDGSVINNAGPGFDDGRGNCTDGVVGVPPAGQRTIRLLTGPQFNQPIATGFWIGQ